MTHNAMKSLWGDGPLDSYKEEKRKNTAKSMISPGERPQDIRTPAALLEAVAVAFGGAIVLDACDSEMKTPAMHHYNGDGSGGPWDDGLKGFWMDRTYCNPPYKTLQDWLEKACQEARQGKRIVVLCLMLFGNIDPKFFADFGESV